MDEENQVSDDAELISGGDNIARFLFGSTEERFRREVYHLSENHELPTFKVGAKMYARKHRLREWIKARERGEEMP